MLDNYEHIAHLITGFNKGTLTEAEHDELDEWMTASDKNQQLFEELIDPEKFKVHLKQMESYDQEEVFQRIRTNVGFPKTPMRRIFPFKKIAVAASIILAIGIGAYLLMFNKHKKDEIVKVTTPHDVEAPKETKAMITLADGRKISIDSLTTLNQADVSLTKTKDGKIVYSGSTLTTAYNTLSNPRGSKVIDMTLSDGSHVWLNAGSSVTYPIAFIGNDRKVSITGEAYFEVVHNSAMPFVVSKNEMQVEVLGTHFNVNAYDDEADIKVTLLEGSVRVKKGSSTELLKPGQQAKVSNEIQIIDGINIDAVMAWKNGMFVMRSADIGTIMRQIARWYDVEVQYENGMPKGTISGEVPRNLSLSDVLKVYEYSGVRFRIEGKKVIVVR